MTKRWSYPQITAAAEEQIKSLHDQAFNVKEDLRTWHRHVAYGVYIGWSNLTMGWMNDGDNERMRELAESVGREKFSIGRKYRVNEKDHAHDGAVGRLEHHDGTWAFLEFPGNPVPQRVSVSSLTDKNVVQDTHVIERISTRNSADYLLPEEDKISNAK